MKKSFKKRISKEDIINLYQVLKLWLEISPISLAIISILSLNPKSNFTISSSFSVLLPVIIILIFAALSSSTIGLKIRRYNNLGSVRAFISGLLLVQTSILLTILEFTSNFTFIILYMGLAAFIYISNIKSKEPFIRYLNNSSKYVKRVGYSIINFFIPILASLLIYINSNLSFNNYLLVLTDVIMSIFFILFLRVELKSFYKL